MAFPASPSNNQVWKEGNRSFVYDSTLGTWDQLGEIESSQSRGAGGGGSISAAGLRGTILDTVTFPPGHVIQTRVGLLLEANGEAGTSYSTSSAALSGTLNGNGMFVIRGANSKMPLEIRDFNATSGNLLVAWFTIPGQNGGTGNVSRWSLGVQFGAANKREFNVMGYKSYSGSTYDSAHPCHVVHKLTSNLTNATIHALLRLEEQSKTHTMRWNGMNSGGATNLGSSGGDYVTHDSHLTVMEVQQ
jgi:hypothetical protein